VAEVEPPKAGIVEQLGLLVADPEMKSVDNMLWAIKIFPFMVNPFWPILSSWSGVGGLEPA
jgi:hypothetical protein